MTYLASFLEGIINFISPRLLPMLPIYLAYFAGSERLDSGAAKSEMAEILTRIAFYAGDPAWAAFKMAKEDAMGSERQGELEHGLVDAADGLAVVVSRRGPRGGSAAEPNPMRTPHFRTPCAPLISKEPYPHSIYSLMAIRPESPMRLNPKRA